MIKSVNLKPFEGACAFPIYVRRNGVNLYTLSAKIVGGYTVVLARLHVVETKNDTTYVLFESYTNHGEKMSETTVKVSGFEHEFMAVKSAMAKVGICFNPITPCHFLELMKALGCFYRAGNPDIEDCIIMSQTCH